MVSHIPKKARWTIVLPLLLFGLATIPYWDYITDDTFITLRYARNLASGHGFSYNPDEPSYGFTSPLWVMLLALFRVLGADLVLTAKVLAIGLGLSCLWVLYLVAKRMTDVPALPFLVALVFAYDPWFIRWSSSGMETSLTLFLIALGYLCYLREEGDGFPLSAILLGLATLARPEAGLFFGLMLLGALVSPARRTKAWQMLVGYLLAVAPWILFSLFRFGTVTPHTLKAKYGVRGVLSLLFPLAVRAGKVMGGTYLPHILLILAVLLFSRFRSRLRPHLPALAWIILLPLFYILGRFPPASRYLMLVFPFIVLLGFTSLDTVTRAWSVRKRLYATSALLTVVLSVNTYLGWFVNYPNCKAFARGMEESHIYIGRWLKANVAPDAIVAASDIGAIGYYSERKILDLGGLTTAELIPLIRAHSYRSIIVDGLYLEVADADYLVDRTVAPFSLMRGSGAKRLYEPLFCRSTPTLGLDARCTPCYYSVYRVRRAGPPSVEND